MTIQNNGEYIKYTSRPPIKTRYFYVAYYTPIRYGNLLYITHGELPNIKELTKEYHKQFPSDNIKEENYIVMGLFEFKSRREADDFFGFKAKDTIVRSGKKAVVRAEHTMFKWDDAIKEWQDMEKEYKLKHKQ